MREVRFVNFREHHPENVFSSMETIMTLVVEESEDISLDLLSPLLDSIKKDNEVVTVTISSFLVNCDFKPEPCFCCSNFIVVLMLIIIEI